MAARSLAILVVLLLVQGGVLAQEPTPTLAGAWPRGEWQNSSNSHRGPLHANFAALNDSQYRVTFGGRFARVIPFRYTVVLNVTGSSGDGTTYLSGTSRLPLFGTFQYDAVATSNSIDTRYQSRRYTGRFLLSR